MRYFLISVFLIAITGSAQVGIGTVTPSPASILDISSSSDGINFGGLLPPRVSTLAQLDAIGRVATATDTGLMIFYDEPGVEQCLKVWDGSGWKNIYCVSSSANNASVSFLNPKQTIRENDGGINFDFTIINPSPFNSLILTIAASNYSNLVEKNPVQLTISRGYNAFNALAVFNYINNTSIQGNSGVVFTITNVTGGDGTPAIGSQNTHTVGIIDDDVKVWINEFRYENAGTDIPAQEFVEVAGNALDITGYKIIHYNGENGRMISTNPFTGPIPNQQAGYGTLRLTITLQNGPDGLALVDPLGNVMQFLSYEGAFKATEGPAMGMTAIDVGVSAPTNVPNGFSLQLIGIGNSYGDFDWDGPSAESPGLKNSGQTFN